MMLVHRIPEGWDSYETIFMVDSLPKGNHTFLWQVREVAQGE